MTKMTKLSKIVYKSTDTGERVRRDARLHTFVHRMVSTTVFNVVIILLVLLSAVPIVMETTSLRDTIPLFFILTDFFFLGVFLIEFLLKLYAEPIGYWKNYYNLFDFTVLVITTVQGILSVLRVAQTQVLILRVTRVLRAVRILRSVSFIRGLQVLVTALLATFLNAIIPLLFFLFIIMFIFSIIGYYWFGFDQTGDLENWGTIGRALLSLFTYVTADGWTSIQERLTQLGFRGSEFFTIIFILLGHFLFINLFIGIIISNIHIATTSFDAAKKAKKDAFIKHKKMAIIQQHHRDVGRVIERQIEDHFKSFQEMTEEFQKKLRHDDFTYSSELCTNKTWMDTYIATLTHLENRKKKELLVHNELIGILTKVHEEKMDTTATK